MAVLQALTSKIHRSRVLPELEMTARGCFFELEVAGGFVWYLKGEKNVPCFPTC